MKPRRVFVLIEMETTRRIEELERLFWGFEVKQVMVNVAKAIKPKKTGKR